MRAIGIAVAVIVALLVAVPLLVLGGANTDPGRAALARLVAWATGKEVIVRDLSGRFPDRLRARHVELRDPGGAWLTVDDAAVDWSPLRLTHGLLQIDRLAAGRVAYLRTPQSSGGSSSPLPVQIDIASLQIDRVDAMGVALAASGRLHLASDKAGNADLQVHRLDAPGTYHLAAAVDSVRIEAHLGAQEADGGMLAQLAAVPQIGAIAATADIAGPRSGADAKVVLSAGGLRADLTGTLDLDHLAGTIDVSASAPAMQPRPDVAWQAAALQAHVTGPLARPEVNGTLRLDGLHVPGPKPDFFAAAPLRLAVQTDLAAAGRPLRITLAHPALGITGTVALEPSLAANLMVTLPDLTAVAGVAGHADARVTGTPRQVAIDSHIDLADMPAATLNLAATIAGQEVTLTRLRLAAGSMLLQGSGRVSGASIDLTPTLSIGDLAMVSPALAGAVEVTGHVGGKPDDITFDAQATGNLGGAGIPPAPLTATLHATGLPSTPSAHLTAAATLSGAPLTLDTDVGRAADGTMHMTVAKADWRSGHVEATLTLKPGAILPEGTFTGRFANLGDLTPVLGRPVSGSIDASGSFAADRVTLRMQGKGVAPLDTFTLQGDGPQDALALKLAASGVGAQGNATARLDAKARRLTLQSAQASWQGQDVALLMPATIDFTQGVSVDRLRLGSRQAVLELAGRITPTLDATASLRDVQAALFAPADGTLRADARLGGTLGQPTGRVTFAATGLRLREAPGRAFPFASVTGDATLLGTSARIDVRGAMGDSRLTVTGTAPLNQTGALGLRVVGTVPLTMLNPLLEAEGRRVRGQIALDGDIAGRPTAPQVNGTLRLTGGSVDDFANGLRLANITSTVRGDGTTIRIEQFSARAGDGTISGSGTVGLAGDMPLDLQLNAHNAAPLSTDKATVVLDSALTLRGAARGEMTLAGTLTIDRAEFRIPDKLPRNIVVLNVRRPGEAPPPPPVPPPPVALDMQVRAVEVYVRGRGVDAELAGGFHVGGTLASPRPGGRLRLRHGTLSLLGQTLNFSEGTIGFDGTNRIDPTLNFVATSTNGGITATLNIAGTASAPKITLSSTPTLPQDEVLARLLFGQSVASLGAFQAAQIALGVAQLTGAGGGVSPLDALRQGLGLDRLNIGSGSNGQGASLEAGRNVAPGVYVGARQSTRGAGPQAVVQVELGHGLKLQTIVGAGAQSGNTGTGDSGNQVGLMYQFEY